MTKFTGKLSGSLAFERSGSTPIQLIPGIESLHLTGSLNITGSKLTFNGTDVINRIEALESGGGSTTSLLPLNNFTGSISNEVDVLSSSLNNSISGLNAATSSYLVDSDLSNVISSSAQISGLGFLNELPALIISSSEQITALGFDVDAEVPSGTVSSSLQISELGFITGSTYDDLVGIPSSIISSSAQISALGFGAGGDSTPEGTVSSSTQILSAVTSGDLDMGGNKVLFGNVYSQLADLPNASTYHGMFAHVHATGKAYFAHNGEWVELANAGSGASIPSGTVSSSAQIEEFGFITSSDVAYDGNRIISNTAHPLFNTFNPGSEGTVTDFLDAMFYPNSAPSITTGNQTIAEFTPSGSSIVTLAGSDAESQAITFTIDPTYTENFATIENGVLKLNVLPIAENFNTDNRGDGTLAHPVVIRATDTIGGFSTKTIYLNVTANTAPIFRETSISGNQISSFSTSRNESAVSGLVSRIYFTDSESDSITITSASDASGHFSLTKYATYVELRQVTSSLDYESITSYNMSITASDEHAVAGDDADAVTMLPISITVVDNAQPTVNNQTLTGVNESSIDGTTAGSITATDPEGNTITFANARLHSLELDGNPVATGSYSGTSAATDPHEDAFSISTNGVVTRKAGVLLNSDIINKYIYEVRVTDAYNTGTDKGLISIPIADDTTPSISGDTTLYVIESAVNGDNIYDNSNGYSGTVSIFSSNQSVTWSVSSSNDFTIDSSGYLFAGRDISGSATAGGSQIDGVVTATNSFGSFSTQAFSVNVTDNQAPNITFSNTSANLNTNKARANSNNLVTITFSDPEGNALDHDSFSATFAGANLTAVKSGDSYLIRATDTLAAGNYQITASISDQQGFATRTSTHNFTIAQAVVGSLSVNGTLYVIESAESGDSIVLGTSGRSGTQGDLSVAYSPSYGSQAVQAFTSSNALIAVNSNGNLTVGNDISGSGNVGGSTISSTINFQDQYGNIGSGSITVNITDNAAPTIYFSDTAGNHNTNLARPGNTLTTVSFSDNEGDGIDYGSFILTDASGKLNAVKSGNSYLIQPNTNLPAATYTYSVSITDEHGFATSTESDSFTVAQADNGTLNGDTTIYVIESAESGDVFRDATGYNNGNAADVGVSYSTSYGSPSVQAFTSSNAAIVINSNGNLSLGVDISGSATSSGDTIVSTITYQDQFGNIGSGTVTANVFANLAPSVSISLSSGLKEGEISNGTNVGTISVGDTESDYPITLTLSGTDASDFTVTSANENGTLWNITANSSLTAGTYSFTANATDSFDKVGTDSDSITVAAPAVSWYAYMYEGGVYATSEANALTMLGDANDDGTTDANSTFAAFAGGNIGQGTITHTIHSGLGITKTIEVGSGLGLSGDRTTALLSDLNQATGSQGNSSLVIVFPSGSDFTLPKTMANSVGGATAGEYVLFADRVGTGINDAPQSAYVRYFDFDSGNTYPNTSIDRFGVLFTQGDATSDITYFLMASSGSAPSSTQ
jgi:hypothetical protein